MQCGGKARLNSGQQRLDPGNDVERRSVARFQNAHQRGAVSIHAHDVRLRRKSVADVGHVVHVYGGGSRLLHRKVVQLRNGLRSPFISTWYSNGPIFAVPAGSIRFCEPMAFTTSTGDNPFDCKAAVSRSTCTCGILPP